ncbi:TPA: hypothetical protein HA318_05055 [Candidatus Micrarchaeota archaeon]|nr:MAG: hypothetical protein AUJ65_05880 [Candidatus Micrarchaeota archaeon CG1_02_51_15]HII39341.1 hypothetical protein [Candidatus Micrarchaeota archaeon]
MTEEHSHLAHHEHHAEHNGTGNGVDKTTFFAAIGVLAVLLILMAAYSFVQMDSINKKLSASDSTLVKLTAIEQRLTALEARNVSLATATPLPEQATLKVYYDSSCTFCSSLEEAVYYMGQQLITQNIQVIAEDVANRKAELKTAGITSLPVLFLADGEEKKSDQLSQLAASMEKVTGGYALDAYGVLSDTKVLLTDGCSQQGKILLDEFYSETCPYCIRLTAGTPPVTANESLPTVLEHFGASLSLTERCIEIHDGDQKLCVDKHGASAYNTSMQLQEQYAISATPTFVADCKYVFGGLTVQQIESKLCTINPTICTARNITVANTTTDQPIEITSG